jgi:NAD(P)H-nitrite reductase large subunit
MSRIDVGASQLVVDGKIKLKNDSSIERFTKTGIKFQNGSELQADVVVFATG